MPDDAAPPPPPRPATRSVRPSPAGRPPPPPPPAGRGSMKRWLMIGIILSSLVLTGLIAFRLWQQSQPKTPSHNINVTEEQKAAFLKGKAAGQEIFSLEAKVWTKNEELGPSDVAAIRAAMKVLEASHEELSNLAMIVRKEGKFDSQDMSDIVDNLTRIKLWILDANDVTAPSAKPPDYGGLHIPMYRTVDHAKKLQKELLEIEKGKKEILDRNDPAEFEAVSKRIRGLEEAFGAVVEKLAALDDYVKQGVDRDDLTPKLLPDLETLRDESSKSGMALKQARELRSQFRKD